MSAIAINTRVCSYCRRTLGWVVCDPALDGSHTHGACGPCAARGHERMRSAAAYLHREYTLEIGAAGEEPATQVATPTGGPGRDANAPAGAVKKNASEALRAPSSSPLPAVSGADEASTFNGSAKRPE